MITNEDRAYRAQNALEILYGGDPETDVTDLLADLMHYCRLERRDFALALRNALMHFTAECESATRR